MKHLLDNDVFFAALFRGHTSHVKARSWLDAAKPAGWGIAVETYLSVVRLLMNPVTMLGAPLDARSALEAVDAELGGRHKGRIVLSRRAPDPDVIGRATGHRQVMDFWLVQVAMDAGATLVTSDEGTLANWPGAAIGIR